RYTPAAEAMIPLLRDESPRVRYFAMEALGRMSWKPAFDAIVSLLAENDDEDVYLRHGGMIALERLGEAAAVAGLANHPTKAVRIAAVAALMRMESPEAARFLDDEDEFVVTSAARAINDDRMIKDAVPALAALLDDPRFMNEPLIRRVINANLYEGTEQSALRLARLSARADVPSLLRIEALKTLEVWPEPSVLDRVTGDPRGPIQNNAEDARQAVEPLIAHILTEPHDELVISALRTVSSLNVETATPDVLALLTGANSPEVRMASLNTLADLGYQAIEAAVFEALNDDMAEVRMNALRMIPILGLPHETATALISPLFDNGTITELRTAINTLADIDHPSAASQLSVQLDRLISDELNPEIQLDLVLAAERTNFPELKDKLETYEAGKARDDSVSVYRETLYGGNANRGRDLFFRDVGAQCINCHMVGGEGADIGPDLSKVAERLSREQFLRAMVSPTEHPVSGYTILTLTMEDGGQVRGVFQLETGNSLFLNVDNEPVEIRKAQIMERRHSPSAMPPMGEVLSRTQIRDIIEYLSTLRAE
ncbi:MAG: heme-binding protein, partial [Balneolaceae bacterium]